MSIVVDLNRDLKTCCSPNISTNSRATITRLSHFSLDDGQRLQLLLVLDPIHSLAAINQLLIYSVQYVLFESGVCSVLMCQWFFHFTDMYVFSAAFPPSTFVRIDNTTSIAAIVILDYFKHHR